MTDSFVSFYTPTVNGSALEVALHNATPISPARDPIEAARRLKEQADGASCTSFAFTCRPNQHEVSLVAGVVKRLIEQGATQTYTVTIS